jgi:hypothetical protein
MGWTISSSRNATFKDGGEPVLPGDVDRVTSRSHLQHTRTRTRRAAANVAAYGIENRGPPLPPVRPRHRRRRSPPARWCLSTYCACISAKKGKVAVPVDSGSDILAHKMVFVMSRKDYEG